MLNLLIVFPKSVLMTHKEYESKLLTIAKSARIEVFDELIHSDI